MTTLPRYKFGYSSDEWGMNRSLGLIADAGGDVCRFSDVKALQARVAELERQNKDLDRSETQLIQERDEREEVINALCDTVLGTDRYEWSSMYSFDDAVEEVAVKTAVLDKEVSELYALRKENAKLAAELTAIKNQELVAWCELSIDGKHIAHFDGKLVIMAGPVGNDCHRTPLFAKPTPPVREPTEAVNRLADAILAVMTPDGYRADFDGEKP